MKQVKHVGVYALAIKDDEILLIKKARGPYTGKWDLPGGSLEFGESPLDGLTRELMEETGLLVQKKELLDVLSHTVAYKSTSGEKTEMYHLGIIYKVELEDLKNLKTLPDGEDSNGAGWLKLSELGESRLSPFAERCIKIHLQKKYLN